MSKVGIQILSSWGTWITAFPVDYNEYDVPIEEKNKWFPDRDKWDYYVTEQDVYVRIPKGRGLGREEVVVVEGV